MILFFYSRTYTHIHYQERGFLPAALVNFVALLGWKPATRQEIFTMQELINNFSLSNINKWVLINNDFMQHEEYKLHFVCIVLFNLFMSF